MADNKNVMTDEAADILDATPAQVVAALKDTEGLFKAMVRHRPAFPPSTGDATVLTRYPDGSPRTVQTSAGALGISDVAVLDCMWGAKHCKTVLLSSRVLRSQTVDYFLSTHPDGCLLRVVSRTELKIKLPALVLRQITRLHRQSLEIGHRALEDVLAAHAAS
ncbi:hypothetical protein [Jongsikchunia kroppenstedtii]|uniref:hypothetical protein n=1 Tax=Jongsikchunia kroppenstedtii TaxID=1121721 RepID=UPI00036EEDDE|nr:hypothetical protein [Jongsikchunia kroppenstedtii]